MFTSYITGKINKPLIPLKAALFFSYGAAISIIPFLQIILKQKGLSIAQISYIYMISPCVQFLGPVLSGIIADKLGRSKPVLLGNVLFAIASLSSILLIPRINEINSENYDIYMTCHSGILSAENIEDCAFEQLKCKSDCGISDKNYSCSDKFNTKCLDIQFTFYTIEIILNVTNIKKMNSSCEIEALFSLQSSTQWCKNENTLHCNLSCQNVFTSEIEKDNHEEVYYDNSTLVFCLILCFIILYNTMSSNAFGIMDVTAMSMVKTYNSDFGRERIWSILGTTLFSVITGFVVEATTKEGQPKHYDTAIYVYIFSSIIAMICIYNLEVVIEPPGKQMVKKSLQVIRNIDVLAFSLAVLILGTCWCFCKQFSNLYLDTLGASGVLIALIPAINNLTGLPFLVTSKFWIEKLGSANILVMAFAGYTIYFIGYIYLVDPWWSLALEVACVLNYHLLWVAVIHHSHSVAPKGLTATVISTAGALHFAIGKGSSSLVGGLTMSKYGGKTSFKVMAATSGGSGLLYALFLYFRHCTNRKSFKPSSANTVEMKVESYVVTDHQDSLPANILTNGKRY